MGRCPRSRHPERDQLADVLDRFAPPLAPFTRCAACNGELEQVSKQDVADELQPGTRRCYDEYARCWACRRVYWHGLTGVGSTRSWMWHDA